MTLKILTDKTKRRIWFLPLPAAIVLVVIVLGGVGIVAALNGWFGGGGRIPSDTFTQGLVGYWPFDEGSGTMAYDASGNGNNGTFGSYMATSTNAWVAGKSGGALQFDGDDSLSIGSDTSLSPNNFTIEAWIKVPSDTPRYGGIYHRRTGGASGNQEVVLYFESSPVGRLYFLVRDQADVTNTIQTTTYLNDNTWHHVVVSIDDDYLRIYVDGEEDASTVSRTIGNVVQGGANLIGWYNFAAGTYYNGLIDEVRIYSRALSVAEVRYHYNRGGPVVHWKMDEGSGGTVYDATENNNDGILHNITTSTAWVAGKYGTAINFDGIDDYVSRAYDSDFDFGTNSFTLSTWFKQEPIPVTTIDVQVGTSSDDGWEIDNPGQSADITSNLLQIFDHTTNANQQNYGGFRFTNITIGQGDTIDVAYFTPYVYSTSQDDPSHDIDLDNSANSSTFTATDGSIKGRTLTGNPVTWSATGVGSGWVNSPSLVAPVQAVVDLGGWASSNAMSVIMDPRNEYIRSFYVESYDFVQADAAKLHIEYKESQYLISRYNAAGFKLRNSGRVCFGADDDATWGPKDQICSTKTDYDDNAWHHVEVIKDGTQSISLYIDGKLAASKTSLSATGSLNGTSPVLYVGGDLGATSTWQGTLDDLRIYNYARTSDEVKLDYNAGYGARFGPLSTCERDPGSCMTQGLVGYWDFEEGLGSQTSDQSDNGNDGTLTNMLDSTNTWVGGIIPFSGGKTDGSALQFDGENGYVNAGTDTNLDIGTNDFTVSAWFKNPRDPNGTFQGLVRKRPGDHTSGAGWILIGRQGAAGNYVAFSVGDGSTWAFASLTLTSFPADNIWFNITYVLDRDTGLRGFFNGTEATIVFGGSANFTDYIGKNIVSSQPLTIGLGSGGYYPGIMDEVRIYNRALSAAEVRYHYNKGGPVVHWKMDEGSGGTVYDSTEKNNDGTLHNITTSTAWVAGKYGSAINLDGADDYVSRAYDTDFNFGTGSFTLSAWFKHNTISADDYLLARYDADQGFKVWMDSSGDMCFGIDDDATWTPDDSACTSGVDYDDNLWHHLAAYRDKASAIYLYIDGKLVASDTSLAATATLTSNSAPLYIGSNAPTLGSYWEGLVDDVRIYNYTRTEEQIRQDYNAGLAASFGPKSTCDKDPGSCMTQGLAGYWDFEEGSGGFIYDKSGNGNNGTLTYMTTSTNPWVSGIVPLSGGKTDGSALQFDGADDWVDVGDTGQTDVKTIEFWVRADDITSWTDYVIDFNGTDYIQIVNGEVTVNNISSPTYYVDGVKGEQTISDTTSWHHIVITTDTDINASDLDIARLEGTSFLDGQLDEVKIYSRALSAAEVRYHYNRGGPIAHWKFDEGEGRTAYDSTEKDNDGTLVLAGSATSSAWVAGKYGGALSFDGVNDYITRIISGFRSSDSAGTVAAWVKTNTSAATTFFSSADTATANFYLLFGVDGGGELFVQQKNNDTVDQVSSVKKVNDNQWHYLTVMSDGSLYSLYIDGVLDGLTVNSGSNTGDWFSDTSGRDNLNIGALVRSSITQYFNGMIDDVRVYNYARTEEQVKQDYNAGLSTYFR